MRKILAWTEPEDPTGPATPAIGTDGASSLDSLGVVLEGDELMQALAHASGRYGLYSNGSAEPDLATDGTGGASGGTPPDDPAGVYTMTLTAARQLHRFLTDVITDLG